jgi:exonuclease III
MILILILILIILVNKKFNFITESVLNDNNDNYMLLKGSTNGVECVIGAVYGPNNNDPVFFDELERDLVQLSNNGQIKTIVGGDWNATWDIRDSQNNIDVINMVTILSKYRSKKISNIAKTMKLTEPFRFLHPVLKEFTYVPSARNNLNRSEIRFLSSIRIVT